ncbi:MAG: DUF2779 domain-containing protein [bacterium]
MSNGQPQKRVPRLSKSRYTSFLSCPRLGYLRAYPTSYAQFCVIQPSRQTLFDAGTRVGELAREYYPGGLLISADHFHIPQAVRQTREALAAGRDVIYEAAVEHDGILVRVDILRRMGDGLFELTEVKSSTKVDPARHVPDVAIQLHVLEGAGLPVGRARLMHIDRDYVHPGGDTYRPRDLFASEDVTRPAREHVATALPGALRDIALWLRADEPPQAVVKNSCRECEYYQGYCRPLCPEFPVTELGRATQAIACLHAAGITDLRELAPGTLEYARLAGVLRASSLGSRVLRMIEAVRGGELQVEPGLGESLDCLTFPLHFLDFESWNPALPVFAGTRPYEQIPFQWSDHRLLADGTLDQESHLAEGSDDPRSEVAATLIKRVADQGSILAYHAAFERARLHDLACVVPALETPLLDIAARLVDLETIVTDHVYHPGFHGRFSLKSVLPALVPGCGYDGLAIREGGDAALAYERLRGLPAGPDRDALRADMLDYCAQDTRGMLEIFRVLRRLT